jgi:Protein of unknown function (DUF1003)
MHYDRATTGERLADTIAARIGSWTFIIVQSVAVAIWVGFNIFGLFVARWDPYPFVLLNLMFSDDRATTRILQEIEHNTELTLNILRYVEPGPAAQAIEPRPERRGDAKPEPGS